MTGPCGQELEMATGLAGIFTSIDTDVLVARTIAIERVPLDRLAVKRATYEAKKTVIESIETRFGHLQDMVDDLKDISNLRGVSAASTDHDTVAVSADAGATEGVYQIEVNRLATSERHVHDGIATRDTALGAAGQFVYTYNGQTRTIQTTDTTTLEELVGLINNDSGNPGVTASVLEYEQNPSQVFHLVLAGADSGSDYQIEIDNSTNLAGFQPNKWTETLDAVDAQIRVDGYPAGDWITKSSNSITDVIPGVTLDLKDVTGATPVTVTMTRSTQDVKNDLGNLAEIYNGIVDTIDNYTGYDEETGQGGALQGDSTLYGLVTRVRSAMTGLLAGFDGDNDTYMLASQVGLEIDREGKMEFDSAAFDTAVEDDYQGVLEVIGAMGQGSTDTADLQFSKAESVTESGVYEVEVDYAPGGSITAARMRKSGQVTWNDATVNGTTITGMLGAAEEGLTLDVVTGGNNETVSYAVNVKKGFAGGVADILDDIMDDIDGAFVTKKSQIDKTVADLSDRIEALETRLLKTEEQLLAKYARMEQLMAQLDAQRGAFEAMISSLDANSNSSDN